MDRAVLAAYGWDDIPTDCEFLLDYEIDEEEWGSKKKPYRYRWPDEVRDEVLARLIALNAERAAEEQRSGAAAAGKRAAATPKTGRAARKAARPRSRGIVLMEAATSQPGVATTPLEVRDRLVEALELDLVGPGPGHPLAEERLPGWERPSNWYLTGFLIPVRSAEEEAGDVDSDEEVDEPQEDDPSDDGAEDRTAAKRRYFPSSLGLSTLVAAGVAAIRVTVRWGDYTVGEQAAEEDGESDSESRSRPRRVWQRTPQERTIEVPLSGSSSVPRVIPVPDSGGLELHILERPLPVTGIDGRIPADTRAVSVFLVNDRDPDPKQRDRAYVFQAGLEVGCEQPFVPRPDLRSGDSDWDEQVADLHYADTPEFATGHGVSVDWDLVDGECRQLRTRWIPSAEVEQTIPADVGGAELRMEALGALVDGAAAQAALAPLVSQYRAWIESRESEIRSTRRRTAVNRGDTARGGRVRGRSD